MEDLDYVQVNNTLHHYVTVDTSDVTKFIVTNVGKSLAVLYCVGLICVIIYHCYFAPRNQGSVMGRFPCRLLSETRPYKDPPPSYNSIHFSELPPHYDELLGYQAAAAKQCTSCSLDM